MDRYFVDPDSASSSSAVAVLGLVGLAVLPGPIRKVLGVDRAFVAAADFAGAVVGTQGSGVAELTIRALGATPRPLAPAAELDGLDAYDQQFDSIADNQYWRAAGFVTANLNLWPRPLAIVVNREAFEGLDADQQDALRRAAEAMVADAGRRARADDRDGAAVACRHGMMLVVAAAADLASLGSALAPVYQELERDPVTAGYLDEIAAIKQRLGAPPDGARCSGEASSEGPAAPAVTVPAGADAAEIPDGRYSRVATVADAERLGLDVEEARRALAPDGEIPITFEIEGDRWTHFTTSDDGVVRIGDSGTASYDADGRWVTVSESPGCPGCVLAYDWGPGGRDVDLDVGPDGVLRLPRRRAVHDRRGVRAGDRRRRVSRSPPRSAASGLVDANLGKETERSRVGCQSPVPQDLAPFDQAVDRVLGGLAWLPTGNRAAAPHPPGRTRVTKGAIRG